eukprot:TRINITY_DN66801_c1_g1_i6.p1 TRINITY_DN66801_c1_g1~~TRINITY_DN66801_c1_g1_i6.p1  ORF type:complete len:212 (-),score=27.26 TRINITY_DN66801_c1_g1_i6:323-868(-)
MSAGEKRVLQTELDFYQLTIPELEQFQQTPLRWDTNKCKGDPESYFLHHEDTAAVLVAPSPKTERTLWSTRFGSQQREFTLERVGVISEPDKFPSLFFDGFGVGLVKGDVTQDGGNKWQDVFPHVGRESKVAQWQVLYDPRTGKLRIKWPTGQTKTWKIKGCTRCHVVGSHTAGVTFHLKQ